MLTDRSGVALVICAPSGTGKTTLIKRLEQEYPRFAVSVSCTTRAPRAGEVNGRDYFFVSRGKFLELREAGHFAEWAEVHGNYYGTPLKAALDQLSAGRDLLFDIDVQGAAQLKKTLRDALFVFLLPPSRAELERRLKARGTENEASLVRRLKNAGDELALAHWFDLWIVNEILETAYEDLAAAYRAATLAPCRRPDFVRGLLEAWR
jgi:guanylate kinase